MGSLASAPGTSPGHSQGMSAQQILSPAQQAQLDNRDSSGKFKEKTHGEVEADDVLGLGTGASPRPTYATSTEAFERGVLPVLGDDADDYNHDGLEADLVHGDGQKFWVGDLSENDLERHCYNMEQHHVESFIEDANAKAAPHRWIDPEGFAAEIEQTQEENFTDHRRRLEHEKPLTHAHYDEYSMVTRAQCEQAAHLAETEDEPVATVTPHDGHTYGSSGSINLHYPEGHPRASDEPYAQIPLDEDDWSDDGEPDYDAIRAKLVAGDGIYGYAVEDEDLYMGHRVEETLSVTLR